MKRKCEVFFKINDTLKFHSLGWLETILYHGWTDHISLHRNINPKLKKFFLDFYLFGAYFIIVYGDVSTSFFEKHRTWKLPVIEVGKRYYRFTLRFRSFFSKK